jgi:hypothetical protein
MAKIEGTIKAGAALDLQIVSADGKLGFHAAEGELSNGVGLGLAADMGKMKVQVTGGGTNKAYWQFPASPGYLKKIEAELVAKIAMDVWLFTKEFEAKHTFVYPESAAPQSLEAPPEVSGDFQPLSRNFLSLGDYNRFVPGTSPIRAPMSVDGALRTAPATVGAETPVVTNVYPRSEPPSRQQRQIHARLRLLRPGKATLQATTSISPTTAFGIPPACGPQERHPSGILAGPCLRQPGQGSRCLGAGEGYELYRHRNRRDGRTYGDRLCPL